MPPEVSTTTALAAVFATHAILMGIDGPNVEAWLAELDCRSEFRSGMWRAVIEALRQ